MSAGATCQRCGLQGGQVLTWTEGGGSQSRWVCPACVTKDEAKAAYILRALRWIAKGHGRWNPDPRQHAANVIEEALKCAKDAIEKAEAKP